MDSLLPTGFILVVLPVVWLVVQVLCWWGLSLVLSRHALPSSHPDHSAIPADVALLSPTPLARKQS
jgi:hypothetical protein